MKKILYVDMDNVIVDFPAGLAKVEPATRENYKGKEDEIPGIFSLMPPMKGAIESLHQLTEYYDIYILSTAPWNNPSAWSDKLIWVKKYLDDIFHKRLIISHNKQLNIGDFLVDDRAKNGASEFKGEWLQFGSEAYPDWPAVTGYLISKAS